MRLILSMMRQVLAAIAASAVIWVKRGGKWILERLPGGGPAATLPPLPAVEPLSATAADEAAPIKRAAGVLAQGKVLQPRDLAGIEDKHLAWLRQLDRLTLCRVLAAEPEQIRAHVLGQRLIRQVPGADAETIAQLKAAREARRQQDMAARSARERRDEVERQILQMETGQAVPAM